MEGWLTRDASSGGEAAGGPPGSPSAGEAAVAHMCPYLPSIGEHAWYRLAQEHEDSATASLTWSEGPEAPPLHEGCRLRLQVVQVSERSEAPSAPPRTLTPNPKPPPLAPSTPRSPTPRTAHPSALRLLSRTRPYRLPRHFTPEPSNPPAADLLADVIIGGAQEEVALEKLMEQIDVEVRGRGAKRSERVAQ